MKDNYSNACRTVNRKDLGKEGRRLSGGGKQGHSYAYIPRKPQQERSLFPNDAAKVRWSHVVN
ncbi:hypothetical protein E2C01_057277 [Portunus trituberculatus]|uniref:Uncharacterized protein n=1 Tax=Portunus trituberculatus TaxID=210409 RepID=A0A5B7GZM1_PORTR|nr:hypothetical protein [Portunus trituberculatus]